jgi:hypothetical protein
VDRDSLEDDASSFGICMMVNPGILRRPSKCVGCIGSAMAGLYCIMGSEKILPVDEDDRPLNICLEVG